MSVTNVRRCSSRNPGLMRLAVSLFLSLTSALSLRLSMLIYSSLAEIDHACRPDNMEYVWHAPMQNTSMYRAYLQNRITIMHQCIKYNGRLLKNIHFNYRDKNLKIMFLLCIIQITAYICNSKLYMIIIG